jgi:hypothetical protein
MLVQYTNSNKPKGFVGDISDISDIDGLKKRDVVGFKCIECGSYQTNCVSRLLEKDGLYCGSCQKKLTCLKLYGSESFMKSDKFIKAKKEYESDPANIEFMNQQRIKSNIKKYGVGFIMQVPEFIERSLDNNRKNHGGILYCQTDESRTENSRRMIDNHGYSEQAKATNIKNNGGIHSLALKENRDKLRKTQTENKAEINTTREETNFNRYGERNPSKTLHALYLDGHKFDSGWEVMFYLYYRDNGVSILREVPPIPYINDDGKPSTYTPDFKIGDKLYELKSKRFIDAFGNIIYPVTKKVDVAKTKLINDLGVIMILESDMKLYKDWFYAHYWYPWLVSLQKHCIRNYAFDRNYKLYSVYGEIGATPYDVSPKSNSYVLSGDVGISPYDLLDISGLYCDRPCRNSKYVSI